MSLKDKEKQLDAKINKLVELEKRFYELSNYCHDFLIKVEQKETKLDIKEFQLKKEYEQKFRDLIGTENGLKKIFEEKSKGFPWLAEAIAEFYKYKDNDIAEYLENKSHPSKKGAEAVKAKGIENRILRRQLKIARNFVNYYETLFPWLADYRDESLSDLLEAILKEDKDESPDQDPVLRFIPKGEYIKLSEEERNQKALNRYMNSRKKSWQIGRDYERFIGYKYEMRGYKVYYEGIVKGFDDLGRDLICIKDNEIEIVQCKCWAKYKTIHEKHINQLYGTVVKYYIEHKEMVNPKGKLNLFPEMINSGEIRATFVTSTKLSDTAMKFADALGIKVEQEKPFEKYPVIKCNIGIKGEKIYHLPFDQQYDKTLISNPGEFYAMTVKEAMEKGFRRAFKWSGVESKSTLI